MHERDGWRLPWMLVAAAAVLIADPASAQPGDYGLPEDSLQVAADAEPLPARRISMECDPFGLRVVRDSADLHAFEHSPGCAASRFPALGRDLYVHVQMRGDCHTQFDVKTYRSASRREYRVLMVMRGGGCRAAGFFDAWYRLPPLPEGWTVAFSRKLLDRRDWTTGRGAGFAEGTGR